MGSGERVSSELVRSGERERERLRGVAEREEAGREGSGEVVVVVVVVSRGSSEVGRRADSSSWRRAARTSTAARRIWVSGESELTLDGRGLGVARDGSV